MGVKIMVRNGTAEDICQNLKLRFGNIQLGLDIVLQTINGVEVYDICRVCGKPVLRTDETISQGHLTAQRLIHKKC